MGSAAAAEARLPEQSQPSIYSQVANRKWTRAHHHDIYQIKLFRKSSRNGSHPPPTAASRTRNRKTIFEKTQFVLGCFLLPLPQCLPPSTG
ncbi:hypothetical protein VFPPC_17390 [Pochonia chlamydosporia 170]|uniref:Uncharacterized protein n=1 Tax=Pochonia chlamydosporia 170 TaxID=1380566 RepID=A0A219ARQ6_METCM|nr:hypothetical protein VFPPC_17390 [Pochonia chlamydosporia 170]OWT43461.1 hypothetical protein VFPPC_17390 [Pochonia chlamydosporia 170]